MILAGTVHRAFGEIDLLFGPAYKGIVLATITALAYRKQFGKAVEICYDRKEQKSHGEGGKLIGATPKAEDRIVVVDDVMSSGGTKLEAVRNLESAGGVRPLGIVIALDRTPKGFALTGRELPPVASVLDLPALAECLQDVDPENARKIMAFFSEG